MLSQKKSIYAYCLNVLFYFILGFFASLPSQSLLFNHINPCNVYGKERLNILEQGLLACSKNSVCQILEPFPAHLCFVLCVTLKE